MKDAVRTLDRLVAKAGQLYSLPTVAMQVLKLTQNPTVDARALKACIENDPALTTKLLRVVNSSLFGLSREVCDLNQALALLGTKPLKLLVLGFSLPKGLFAGVGAAVLARYWRRTLTKAIAARELCETVWRQPGDEAFIAGLLQDLGMLLLIQDLDEPFVKFIDKVLAMRCDLKAMEIESMGFDHVALTGRLLGHWGLPQALIDAVNFQPDPSTDEAPMLAQVLYLAELLAQVLVDGREESLAQLLASGQKYHGMTAQQVEQLVDSLEHKVQQLAGVLRLQLPENTDYREILLGAHVQLAEVASDAAEMMVREQLQNAGALHHGPLAKEFRLLSEALAKKAPQRDSSPCPSTEPAGAETIAAELSPVHSPAAAVNPCSRQRRPLATLDVEPEVLGQLTLAVANCRRLHCALSLLLVELDHAEALFARYGADRLGNLRRFVEAACRKIEFPCTTCLPHGEIGFAVILPGCDRQTGVQLGNQLIDSVRHLGANRALDGRSLINVSAGLATVALPPKNFPPRDLLEAAERCLYGAHSCGGVLKSIEIY